MAENRIRELRKQKKMTQVQLADAMGVTQGAIQKLENGIMELSLKWIEQISAALRVKPFELLPQEWQPLTTACNSEDLAMIIELVENQLQAARIILSPQEKAKLIVILLEMAQEQPANENLKKEFEKTISLYSRVISA